MNNLTLLVFATALNLCSACGGRPGTTTVDNETHPPTFAQPGAQGPATSPDANISASSDVDGQAPEPAEASGEAAQAEAASGTEAPSGSAGPDGCCANGLRVIPFGSSLQPLVVVPSDDSPVPVTDECCRGWLSVDTWWSALDRFGQPLMPPIHVKAAADNDCAQLDPPGQDDEGADETETTASSDPALLVARSGSTGPVAGFLSFEAQADSAARKRVVALARKLSGIFTDPALNLETEVIAASVSVPVERALFFSSAPRATAGDVGGAGTSAQPTVRFVVIGGPVLIVAMEAGGRWVPVYLDSEMQWIANGTMEDGFSYPYVPLAVIDVDGDGFPEVFYQSHSLTPDWDTVMVKSSGVGSPWVRIVKGAHDGTF